MEKQLRITKLKQIQEREVPYQTGFRIRYKGDVKPFNVYKIPLKFLIYNKYNGRIGSRVKTFEKQRHELDAENDAHKKIIEDFLWESKIDRNENTMQDILRNGQLKVGIVTSDGVIIDGNRRALLLNRIWEHGDEYRGEHNIDNCEFFNAVILPEDADPKEIQKLETTYQMGEDEKLPYDSIEKYLKIKDLIGFGFDASAIAIMFQQEESKIKEWIEIMKLMDEYLDYLGYSGVYTRLEKTEGPLVDLNIYNKRYGNGSQSRMVSWPYTDLDLNEMRLLCFDYIRARYEGKEFRKIAQPSTKESIFCKSKELWDDFLAEHNTKIRTIQEKSVQELINESPDEDLAKLTSARDKDWTEKANGLLKGNFNKHFEKLQDLNDADQPVELATKALNALAAINKDVPQFFEDASLMETLKSINQLSFEMMREIKKHR